MCHSCFFTKAGLCCLAFWNTIWLCVLCMLECMWMSCLCGCICGMCVDMCLYVCVDVCFCVCVVFLCMCVCVDVCFCVCAGRQTVPWWLWKASQTEIPATTAICLRGWRQLHLRTQAQQHLTCITAVSADWLESSNTWCVSLQVPLIDLSQATPDVHHCSDHLLTRAKQHLTNTWHSPLQWPLIDPSQATPDQHLMFITAATTDGPEPSNTRPTPDIHHFSDPWVTQAKQHLTNTWRSSLQRPLMDLSPATTDVHQNQTFITAAAIATTHRLPYTPPLSSLCRHHGASAIWHIKEKFLLWLKGLFFSENYLNAVQWKRQSCCLFFHVIIWLFLWEEHSPSVVGCLVTCHLHFWQNDPGLLRATAVTRGWNGH